jgi:formylglycine-generating enzyme required for sulfatase activity
MVGMITEAMLFMIGCLDKPHPEFPYVARKEDPNALKRKVIKGGSWKDISYYLQCGVRTYEYQYEGRSYIGFRCVRSYMGQ